MEKHKKISGKHLDSESLTETLLQMKNHKKQIQSAFRREYRNVRRYVRANPEKSIACAFICGIAAGMVLSGLSD